MTKRNLLDLAKSLRSRAADYRQSNAARAVLVADAVIKDLIYVTPVDTTNALSNWQISLDKPATIGRGPYVPGFLGYTATQSQAQAYAAAQSMLKQHKPGQTIYISNLAEYIVDLDNGSSKQEPAGFVARSVLIGRKILRNIKT